MQPARIVPDRFRLFFDALLFSLSARCGLIGCSGCSIAPGSGFDQLARQVLKDKSTHRVHSKENPLMAGFGHQPDGALQLIKPHVHGFKACL